MKCFILATVLFFAPKILACSCAPIDSDVENAVNYSVSVFMGIPIDVEMIDDGGWGGPKQRTTFKIVSSFKGQNSGLIEIVSRLHGASCGVSFPINGGVYTVFSHLGDEDGVQFTSSCRSTIVAPENEVATSLLSKLADLSLMP